MRLPCRGQSPRHSAQHKRVKRGDTAPAPSVTGGHPHQSAPQAQPHRPTPEPMGRRERGTGPGRAETACGPQPPGQNGQKAKSRQRPWRPSSPGRCLSSRLPPLHRHTALPYELVQRQVRHLVAAPSSQTQRESPGRDITPLPLRAPPPPEGAVQGGGQASHNPPRRRASFAYAAGTAAHGATRGTGIRCENERSAGGAAGREEN